MKYSAAGVLLTATVETWMESAVSCRRGLLSISLRRFVLTSVYLQNCNQPRRLGTKRNATIWSRDFPDVKEKAILAGERGSTNSCWMIWFQSRHVCHFSFPNCPSKIDQDRGPCTWLCTPSCPGCSHPQEESQGPGGCKALVYLDPQHWVREGFFSP